MPEYRRGREAIEAAAASKGGGGGFRSFVPEIYWKDADEKKYILVLTPIDEIGSFDLHEFIPIKGTKANGEEYTRNESFLSRKDPMIGDDYDKIQDELGRDPKTRLMGVAVELEPVMEVVKGRKRPTGFTVKVNSYERKTDDGEEEVEYPIIGLITQSSKLMWSPLNSLDESRGPLSELPLEVIRRIPGEKSSTYYEFIPFMDIEVDLTPVIDYVDGISYLGDVLDELVLELESIGDDTLKQAQAVARALFEKRVEQLSSQERYDELLGDVDELPPLPWGPKKKASSTAKKATRSRPAQRRKSADAEPEVEATEEAPTEEPKSDRFAALKARIEAGKE